MAWDRTLSQRQFDPHFMPSIAFCDEADRLQRAPRSPLAALMAAGAIREACAARKSRPPTEAADAGQVRDLAVRLRAAGFSDLREPDARWVSKDPSGESVLEAGGLAARFDAENSTVPSQHHLLMLSLAPLASPALDDVVFEEHILRPPDEVCELVAYADGLRFRTPANDYCSDWYDLDAVARLMNAVLQHRRAPGRLVFLHTEDQTASLAYGTAAAFKTAFAQGLLQPGDGSRAEALGKAFEREVIGASAIR